jgi:hypothetical protein
MPSCSASITDDRAASRDGTSPLNTARSGHSISPVALAAVRGHHVSGDTRFSPVNPRYVLAADEKNSVVTQPRVIPVRAATVPRMAISVKISPLSCVLVVPTARSRLNSRRRSVTLVSVALIIPACVDFPESWAILKHLWHVLSGSSI